MNNRSWATGRSAWAVCLAMVLGTLLGGGVAFGRDSGGGDRSIAIRCDTAAIIADGTSAATLVVKTTPSELPFTLYADGEAITGNRFRTTVPGEHTLEARADGVSSGKIVVMAREAKEYDIVEVPVVFHVVHLGESIGNGNNLAAETLSDALALLNKGFSNDLGSLDPNAVDTRVRFRLATINRNGDMMDEPGIDRIDGSPYDTGSPSGGYDEPGDGKFGPNETWRIMGNTFWDPREYSNVWVLPKAPRESSASSPRVREDHPLPGLIAESLDCPDDPHSEWFDSCNVHVEDICTNVFIHEMGHKLGLLHTFSVDSGATSDFCDDTYSYRDETDEPCSVNIGISAKTNHMDLAGAKNTFTYDQRERIQFLFQHGIWLKDLKNSRK